MSRKFIHIVAAGVLAACGYGAYIHFADPMRQKLPQETEKIADIAKKLNGENRELLAAYVMRAFVKGTLLGGMAGDVGDPSNITVGQAIENQKRFVAAQAEKEKNSAAAQAEMLKATEITEMHVTEVGRSVFFEFKVANKTELHIAQLKGSVVFYDLVGDKMTEITANTMDELEPGKSYGFFAEKSLDNPGAARVLELGDRVKYKWMPNAIAFKEDGRVLKSQ